MADIKRKVRKKKEWNVTRMKKIENTLKERKILQHNNPKAPTFINSLITFKELQSNFSINNKTNFKFNRFSFHFKNTKIKYFIRKNSKQKKINFFSRKTPYWLQSVQLKKRKWLSRRRRRRPRHFHTTFSLYRTIHNTCAISFFYWLGKMRAHHWKNKNFLFWRKTRERARNLFFPVLIFHMNVDDDVDMFVYVCCYRAI